MERLLTFVVLTTLLTLSEQTPLGNGEEEVVVKEDQSVPRSPPDGYEYVPGIGYYKFVTTFETFDQAWDICRMDGANLAVVNSLDEAYGIVTVMRQKYNPAQGWPTIGFADFLVKGEFKTVFGDPIESTGYSYWNPGEPATLFEKNCGCLNVDGRMGTHCCDCGRTYICEFPLSN